MQIRNSHAACLAILGFLFAGIPAAHAEWVKPVAVTSSSNYPTSEGVSYDVANLSDGKASNVWIEGEEGSGLGSWVKMDFGAEKVLDSFTIWNGNWYSWDFWERHNRPKDIEIEFSDGTIQKFTLKDEKVPEVIRFPSAVRTTSMKIKIKDVYRGTTFNDTVISEVLVHDTTASSWLAPVGGSDSSHLAEDGDGSYVIANMYDSLLDTMWCESHKSGDGSGAWAEFLYGRPVQVSGLTLRNGNAYSLAFWMKASRATSAQLRFSDGSTENIAIRDTLTEQRITFPTHTTSSVRITFATVSRGKGFQNASGSVDEPNLCVSEARFSP